MSKPLHYWKHNNTDEEHHFESGLSDQSKLSDNARLELSANDTSTSREDSQHDSHMEPAKRRSKWLWIIIAVVIVGVIMAIWVPLIAQPNASNKEVQSEAEAEKNDPRPPKPTVTDVNENEDEFDDTEDFDDSTGEPVPPSVPDNSDSAPAPTAVPTPVVTPSFPMWTSETIKYLQSISYAPERFLDTNSYEYAAAQWLDFYTVSVDVLGAPEFVAQRYALTLLDMSLHDRNIAVFATTDEECEWYGITCNNDTMVESIIWNDQSLAGTLPPDIGLLENLVSLDLGANQLRGQLPEAMFEMENLVSVYLHDNQFTGTLSTSISKLANLDRFFLSKNGFSGSFPFESCLGLPLRWFSVFDNQFTGQLPETFSWRQIYYFDLGKNQFSGTIPSMNDLVHLRHLYLDHNKFSGPLPSNWFDAGGGRMSQVIINDNDFTGQFPPEGYDVSTMLEAVEIHNNFFDQFNSDICRSSIWEEGELILLRANCGFCKCNVLCESGRCIS
jgi:hypothetical protein